MNVSSNKEITVTLTLNEREAKLLTCLMGALHPEEAEGIIKRSIYFHQWFGTLTNKEEVPKFNGTLFNALSDLF